MIVSLHRFRVSTLALVALLIAGCSSSNEVTTRRGSASLTDYTLRISEDGRRIVRGDGTPFIWLGDTAWELFHRLTREEAGFYIADRSRKGFNVIQAVVLAELEGLTVPNAYGEVPLIDNDPTKPNEAYFEHVDYIVRAAEQLGMFIGMLPTWGDKFNKKWGVGPEVFTPENARVYGRFLGERYRNHAVIWILGGDRIPENEQHLAIIRAMAEGIEEGNGGTQLMTYHPMGGQKSWTWFHEDAWLDFNMFQSGHSEADIPNYEMTAEGYALTPVKPVIDGEPRYEDHPINWKPENGWFTDWDVRQAAYWSMLAGAAGHTYGNHNIWQMWESGRQPISSARTPWRRAVGHIGSAQVGYMKQLFESRPFLELVPDQSVLQGDTGQDGSAIRAARSREGRYLIVYTPTGKNLTVDLEKLQGEKARAWWFSPRSGEAMSAGSFASTGVRMFDPPGLEGRGNDWVLVVDDAAQGFAEPGKTTRR